MDEQAAVNTHYLRQPPMLRTTRRLFVTSLVVLAACLSHGRLRADDDSDSRYDWFSNEAGDKWGVKDTKTGKVVFAPRFNGGTGREEGERLGTDLKDGRAWVYEKDNVELIDVSGQILAHFKGSGVWPWHGDLFILNAKTGYGIVSNTGKIILSPTCYQISDYSDGMAILGLPDPKTPKQFIYGYIDGNGAVAIQPQFGGADPFSEGLARVCKDGTWQFIDKTGKRIFIPATTLARPFSEGLSAAYTSKDGWGFIDRTGKFVIQPKYEDVYSYFDKGRTWAGVPSDSRRVASKGWVLLDTEGHELTPPIYWRPPAPMPQAGESGMGNWFAIQNEELETGGLYRAWGKDGVGLLASDGKVVVPPTYKSIGDFAGGHAAVSRFDGTHWTRGLIDIQGKEVLPLGPYDQIVPLQDGTANVSKGGKTTTVDGTGRFTSDFH